MKKEEWRRVVGYEGVYEVSTMGRLRSLDKLRPYRGGAPRFFLGRVLKLGLDKKGYLKANITNKTGTKTARVHRLVAMAFIPRKDGREKINHKDGDKLNNQVGNLEWCNTAENNSHSYLAGLRHGRSVTRSDGAVFKTAREAARAIGTTGSSVTHNLKKQSRTCMGFSFTYMEAKC